MGTSGQQNCRGGEVTLVLGGARSGKSRLAEEIATLEAARVVYVATAEAGDEEMAARIAEHQARRGTNWQTEELPLDLAGSLPSILDSKLPVLVDCLTLWLTNLMLAGRPVEAEIEALLHSITDAQAPLVLVSNETGLGIVPEHALARQFRDLSGRMNQQIAAAADNVLFVAAGLPIVMKGRNPAAAAA